MVLLENMHIIVQNTNTKEFKEGIPPNLASLKILTSSMAGVDSADSCRHPPYSA